MQIMIKPVSGNCNMVCDYCFYCDVSAKRKQYSYGVMSDDTLKNVIRKTLRFAKERCAICFQGGEPTLAGLAYFNKVVSYVEQYNRQNIPIEYAIQTNGLSISEEWCTFFRENKFLVGLSVDGIEKTHDVYRHNHRGEATYQDVYATAKLFEQTNVEFNILTVVNRATATHIKEIYEDYKRNNWKFLQFIACLDGLGDTRGTADYSLTPEIYGKFLGELFHLWYRDWKRGKQPYIRFFENYVGMIMGYPPESCEHKGICGIQNIIEADGSVYPCDFFVLEEYCLGNLNHDTMRDIYQKREQLAFIAKSRNHCAECKACKYFTICRGGCDRNRNHGVQYFCQSYKMFFDTCYDKLKDIADYIAPPGKSM